MNAFHPSATVTGGITMTDPVNEPVREYRPGSPEAVSLEAEIARVGGEVRELPHVINGERLPLTDPVAGRCPARSRPRARPLLRGRRRRRRRRDRRGAGGPGRLVPHPVVGPGGGAAPGRRAGHRQVPRRAQRDHDAGSVEDVPPGRDRRRLRDGRLLPLQRPFAAQIYATQPPSPAGEFNFLDHKGLEGFVLAITPFNFTAIGGNLSTMPALMGNTVVWKPSEKAALSAQVLMKVLRGGRLPARGDQPGARLRRDSRPTARCSTSSSPGWRSPAPPPSSASCGRRPPQHRAATAATRGSWGRPAARTPSSPTPSADVDAVLVALVRGAFEFQGQKCSAASRAYIPRSVWKDLEARLAETIGQFKVGDPTEHETFLGAVIDEGALRPAGVHHRPGQEPARSPHHHRRHGRHRDGLVRRPDRHRGRRPRLVPDGEGVLRAAAGRPRLRRRRLGQGAAAGRLAPASTR